MALSTVIFVGETDAWLSEIVDKARKLKVGPGVLPGTDVGPLISPQVISNIFVTSADNV